MEGKRDDQAKYQPITGTLEVEGEEEFVKSVYEQFKEELARTRLGTAVKGTPAGQLIEGEADGQRKGKTAEKTGKKSSSKRAKTSFSIVKDLDLSDKTNSESLRAFYASKAPTTAMECNAVFVYYLQQIAKVQPITLDRIYSCYKDVSIKYPNALRQSVADTSSRRGWLDTKSFDDIRLATPGENFVEHDLPTAKPE
jgi:hypothetical protein